MIKIMYISGGRMSSLHQRSKSMLSSSAAHPVDVVFSHTCPYKYVPTECFLPGIDQSTVDNSTEHWLDSIEEMLDYKAWYLGHWHINKRIDKFHFLMHDVEMLID